MVPFQIKICGVTNALDARHACQSGADAIGLNFYEKSSRYVSIESAREIAEAIRQWSRNENRSVLVVGVFVNDSTADLAHVATEVGLDGVQLHGDELPSQVAEIRVAVQSSQLKILRAIRTQPSANEPVEDADSNLVNEMVRIEEEIKRWESVGIDAVLLDAAVEGEFGGTGKSVDWTAVSKLSSNVGVVLAGGLTAENVANAIVISKTSSVDVASGVESQPGEKDDELVNRFVSSAKKALG